MGRTDFDASNSELLAVMVQGKGWVGLPALFFRGVLIDGRRRSEIAARYGYSVPRRNVRSWRELARLLALQKHDARAIAVIQEHGGLDVTRQLLESLRIPRQIQPRLLQTWRTLQRRGKPGGPGKDYNQRARSQRVVSRLRRLVTNVEERGTPATLGELQRALTGDDD